MSQLSVAWCTLEQLKADNEDLKAENDELHARLNQIDAIPQDHVERYKAMKVNMNAADMQNAGLQNSHALTSHIGNIAVSHQRNSQQTAQPTHKDANTMFDLSAKQDVAYSTTRDGQQHMQADDTQRREPLVYEARKTKEKGGLPMKQSCATKVVASDDSPRNLTYLSFIDVRFFSSGSDYRTNPLWNRLRRSPSLGRLSSRSIWSASKAKLLDNSLRKPMILPLEMTHRMSNHSNPSRHFREGLL